MSEAFTDGVAVTYGDLNDRSVLVTGGGSGIGAAIVEAFCAQGARVAFLDIADEPAKALTARLAAKGHAPLFIRCDLTRPDEIVAAAASAETEIGPIGVLVNNAANDQRHSIDTLSADGWNDCLAVNLTHQFLVTKAVLPRMRNLGRGSIINMTSTSFMVGVGKMPAYTAAKAAVIGLTRSIARDFGPHGIRCNAVAPGWVMTERQIALWLDPESEKRLLEDQCIKAKLYPEDIAPAVLFLASRASGAITGQTIVVDAGHL